MTLLLWEEGKRGAQESRGFFFFVEFFAAADPEIRRLLDDEADEPAAAEADIAVGCLRLASRRDKVASHSPPPCALATVGIVAASASSPEAEVWLEERSTSGRLIVEEGEGRHAKNLADDARRIVSPCERA